MCVTTGPAAEDAQPGRCGQDLYRCDDRLVTPARAIRPSALVGAERRHRPSFRGAHRTASRGFAMYGRSPQARPLSDASAAG